MRNRIAFMVLFLGVAIGQSQETDTFFSTADAFFKTHVANGRVDYKAIAENPSALNTLVDMAHNISVSKEKDKEYKAFWVNAYNMLVIKGIVENYPLQSPLNVDGFFDKQQYSVGGKMITLNAIENEVLRANFPNEPRFHFVLVCAGLGCPPIINQAYMPSKIESQLQQQTTKALNDAKFIRVEGNSAKVSQIFEWYKGDFERAGGILSFINRYRTPKLPKAIDLGYYPYDWTLNSK